MKKKVLYLLGILLLVDRPTRQWLSRQISSYFVVVAYSLIVSIPLIFIGIILPWRIVPLFVSLSVITMLAAVYLPFGAINAAFNPYHEAVTNRVKRIAGWLAFFGWLGVVHNVWLNFWVVGVGLLLGLIYATFAPDKKIDKLVVGFVTVMTVWSIWAVVAPDSHRAAARFAESATGVVVTTGDRASIKMEGEAATTYARPNQNIRVLYIANVQERDSKKYIAAIWDTTVNLTPDSLVKVLDHKSEALTYQGQAFVQIQLCKANGSFVNGKVYWAQADQISIVSPMELSGGSRSTSVSSTPAIQSLPSSGKPALKTVVLTPGQYGYTLKAGQETDWFSFPTGKYVYQISSSKYAYQVVYSDGGVYQGGDASIVIPERIFPVLKIHATADDSVSVVVTAKS